MAILLIGLIILLCGLAYGLLKPARRAQQSSSLPSTNHRTFNGLFAEQLADESRQLALAAVQSREAEERNALLQRAQGGDTGALAEAAAHNDAGFYQQTLDALINAAQGEQDKAAVIADTIIDSGTLRANARLADLLMEGEPGAPSVARLLYIAALSDDEACYCRAVRTALHRLQQGQIAAAELRALVESSYWLLAPEIRAANFSLQQLMAEVRRALAATPAPSHPSQAQ